MSFESLENYIRPSDAARRLGVSRQAIYKWIKEGKIGFIRLADRAIRIPESSLQEFIKHRNEGLHETPYTDLDKLNASVQGWWVLCFRREMVERDPAGCVEAVRRVLEHINGEGV